MMGLMSKETQLKDMSIKGELTGAMIIDEVMKMTQDCVQQEHH